MEDLGVLTSAELQASGLTRDAIATRAGSSRLRRRHHGVYAVGSIPLSLEGEFLAAVKACGAAAVLSHRSAGVLWEMLETNLWKPEVLVAGASHRAHPGITVHRTNALAPHEIRHHRGVPVTAPLRTLRDLAVVLLPQSLRAAVRRAQAHHLVHHREIAGSLGLWRGRRGIRALAEIVATGPAPTRTVLEDVVYDLIIEGGFEPPEVNARMVVNGRTVIPDFRWPVQRLIVEADSRTWHDGELAREDDAERQALLEASGERVLRVTWVQATQKRSETHARLRAAGAPVATP
jgi:very-short-patch-repair endonuclease